MQATRMRDSYEGDGTSERITAGSQRIYTNNGGYTTQGYTTTNVRTGTPDRYELKTSSQAYTSQPYTTTTNVRTGTPDRNGLRTSNVYTRGGLQTSTLVNPVQASTYYTGANHLGVNRTYTTG
jgi:hypothetical protein